MNHHLPESKDIQRLLDIMARLRDPDGGCPWDREQDFASIAPYTIEEAYEVAEAIAHQDEEELRDELGDLLFQVVFHARMAEERDWFGFDDVVEAICDKMIRRHPHVFADAEVADAREQTEAWEDMKARERARKQQDSSILAGVSLALPGLTRARKLQARAARVGFDWPEQSGVLAKVHEELREVEQALESGTTEAIEEELGDLLFAVVNLARHREVDPEAAVRAANSKFTHRFQRMEQWAKESCNDLSGLAAEAMDALWEKAKQEERGG
ncbi:MAG: nucleoside triphosphate pyrophosphohydrolase [Gammaproteobacteria bacterium]|nr:nucleoside triphosphate pyrophosphohydrolase [Gammaproteobacteria bacterium]